MYLRPRNKTLRCYLLCLLLHSLGRLLDDFRLSGYLDGLLAAHRRFRLRRDFFYRLRFLNRAYGFLSVLAGFIRFVSCFGNVRCRSLLRSFAATLSVLPCESPSALRAKRRLSPPGTVSLLLAAGFYVNPCVSISLRLMERLANILFFLLLLL